jgi:hypothetical protein
VTGNLIWAWDPPASTIPRCPQCYLLNPLNRTMMTQQFFNPTNQPALQYPSDAAGFEDEQAYNPVLNYVFAVAQWVPGYVSYVGLNSSTYFTSTGEAVSPVNLHRGPCSICKISNNNATVFAVDAATGLTVWQYFIPTQGYRGGVSTSGGNLVFLALSSGDLLMLNAQTGALVNDYHIGGPLNVLPSIGATASGHELVVVPVTAGIVTWGTGVPGAIVALTLQEAQKVVVSTTTMIFTVTTTTSAGVSTTTAYGIATVAVISMIAAGYLATKTRKPTP